MGLCSYDGPLSTMGRAIETSPRHVVALLHVRAYTKRGKYTSNECEILCVDSDSDMEYISAVTPQLNGVGERDGSTLVAMTRCMLKDGNDMQR